MIERTIADDCSWRFPGRRGRLAGVHAGRDAILRFLLQVVELTGGTFHLDLIDVVANDRHAVVLFRGRATRNGKELDNPTCLRIALEGGLAVDVWSTTAEIRRAARRFPRVRRIGERRRALPAGARWGAGRCER